MININMDIQNIFLFLKFESLRAENNFTPEQIYSLISILDKINDIDFSITKANPFKLIRNIKKAQKLLKEFESTFKSYGGDVDMLENKLKKMKSNRLKAASDIFKLK